MRLVPPTWRAATRAALAALAATATPLHAQGAAVPEGAARVSVDGGAFLAPGPVRSWSVGGAYLPFVTPRWQAGLAPEYGGVTGRDAPTYQRFQLAAVVNHLVPLGGVQAYAGGYAARTGTTGAPRPYAANTYGAQAGLLRFVAPAAALRAEVRYRRTDRPGSSGFTQVVLALDPYVGGAATARRWTPPGLGAVDVDALGNVDVRPDRRYSGRLTAAPFVARWAQLGARAQGSYFPRFRTAPWALTGFGRLYAPLPGRTAPYAEAFATWSAYSGGRDGALSSYGAVAGVRRYVGPNAAFDLGVVREEAPPYRFPNAGVTFRAPGRTSLRLGAITHLRRGRGGPGA